jgi:hypothetical protein
MGALSRTERPRQPREEKAICPSIRFSWNTIPELRNDPIFLALLGGTSLKNKGIGDMQKSLSAECC